ncbi:AT-rich interactive domain-containing protein 4B-like isoform X2 [Artemia franciscana]|uniref:ARID domain-containing protein n=1 Tax=Artemia franciscana TaxID=6661 RepID=A0AA88KX18_ARTSF|nr:hypothetical protein QYM36_015048 [Artemia franciscana]
MNEDPPFLNVGTEVSAKYKGAFCEAKVHKVVKSIKCRVQFKFGLGSAVVSDECIKGSLRTGAQVEAKHPEKNQFLEAVISKIQDCSQYTVVFDDGDITTLRRTALCLKSGRHFAESETLDQLPLTHPEHFGTPVGSNRRGRRSQLFDGESDDDDGDLSSKDGSQTDEREVDIGKVICVEIGERKRSKENWFPGLVVAPTAQDQVSIRIKEEYLVRSFKDGRYYTVPKNETADFLSDSAASIENQQLKHAVENALLYLENDALPSHWDRKALFGVEPEAENTEPSDDSESEDESPETKDHFVAQLYKHMDDRGTPINKEPTIGSKDLDLYRLFKVVHKMGGFNRVTNQNMWRVVVGKMSLGGNLNAVSSQLKQLYKKYLLSFEEFYRKLGVTLLNSPRTNRNNRSKPGRSLMRGIPKKLIPDKPCSLSDSSESSASKFDIESFHEQKKKQKEDSSDEKPLKVIKAIEIRLQKVARVTTPKREGRRRTKSEDKMPKAKVLKRRGPKAVTPPKSDPNTQPIQHPNTPKPNRSTTPKPKSKSQEPTSKIKKSKSEPKLIKDGEASATDFIKTKPKSDTGQRPSRNSSPVKTQPKKEDSDDESDDTPRKRRLLQRSSSITVSESGETKRTRKKKLVLELDSSIVEGNEKPQKKNRSSVLQTESPSPLPRPDGATPLPRGRPPKHRHNDARPKAEFVREGFEGELPKEVDVQFNDKLRVYYGNTQGTVYEAKVMDIRLENDVETYMVHYTGWNIRYDEWITRSRIAQNLTWTPNRKRVPIPIARSDSANRRGRSSLGRSPQPSSRSGTPSSITSSISCQSTVEKPRKDESPKIKDDRKDETGSGVSDSSDDDSNLSGSDSDSDTLIMDEPPTSEFDLRKIHADLKLTPTKVVRNDSDAGVKKVQVEEKRISPPIKAEEAKPSVLTSSTPESVTKAPPGSLVTRASPRRGPARKKLLEEAHTPGPTLNTSVKSDSSDVYEFSEPEPFVLEMRTKKISSPIYDERNVERKMSLGQHESESKSDQGKLKSPPEKLKSRPESKLTLPEFKQDPLRLGLCSVQRPEPQKEARQAIRIDYIQKDVRTLSARNEGRKTVDSREAPGQPLHTSAFAKVQSFKTEVKTEPEKPPASQPASDPSIDSILPPSLRSGPEKSKTKTSPIVDVRVKVESEANEKIMPTVTKFKIDPPTVATSAPLEVQGSINPTIKGEEPSLIEKTTKIEQEIVCEQENANIQDTVPTTVGCEAAKVKENKPNVEAISLGNSVASRLESTTNENKSQNENYSMVQSFVPVKPIIGPNIASMKEEKAHEVKVEPSQREGKVQSEKRDLCKKELSEPVVSGGCSVEIVSSKVFQASPYDRQSSHLYKLTDHKISSNLMQSTKRESQSPATAFQMAEPKVEIMPSNLTVPSHLLKEVKPEISITSETIVTVRESNPVKTEEVSDIPCATSLLPIIKVEQEAPSSVKKEMKVETEEVVKEVVPEPELSLPVKKEIPVEYFNEISIPDSEEPPKKRRKRPIRKPVRSSEYIEFSDSDSSSDDSSLKLTIDIREESTLPEFPNKLEVASTPFHEPNLLCEETIPGSPVAAMQEDLGVEEKESTSFSTPTSSHEEIVALNVKKSGPKLRPILIEERPKQGPKFRARPVVVDSFESNTASISQNTPPTSPDTSASTLSSPKSSPKSDNGEVVSEYCNRQEENEIGRPRDEHSKRGPNHRRGYVLSAPYPVKKSPRSGNLGSGRSPRRSGICEDLLETEPRTSRYNFIVDLAPEMDSTQRISILQEKMKQIRKVYADLKAEVASIDRRRKKIKKKEKQTSLQ